MATLPTNYTATSPDPAPALNATNTEVNDKVNKRELVYRVADYASTAATIAAAPAGSTILYTPGTYQISASVAVSKSLTFVAQPGAVIDARLPLTTDEKLFNVTASNVIFDGLVIDGVSATAGTLTIRHVAVYVGDGTTTYKNIHVRNCTFRNLNRKGTADAGGDSSLQSEYAVYFNKVSHGSVINCTLEEISGAGIFVKSSERIRIRDNDVAMIAASDCLYPIHLDEGNVKVWVDGNHVIGGDRSSGGAIDVMSISAPSKRIYVTRNVIDGSNGFGSGNTVIRFLSVEDGEVTGNIVRNVTSDGINHIFVDYRDLPTAQPGPRNNIIRDNVLVAGGPNQRAIDVRNGNSASAAANVTVEGNVCDTDGTNYFGAGIRMRDIARGKVRHNTVVYKYSAGTTSSWGIELSASTATVNRPVCEGNEIDCQSSASSRGIQVTGPNLNRPIIRRNTVTDWGAFGLRLESTVADPTIQGNTFDGPASTSAISNLATGQTHREGNRLSQTAATAGTFTITAGTSSVTVTTAEVQTGDHILLTVTGSATTDVAVKATAIVNGTSFSIRTVNQANVSTTDLTGTWRIVH